MHLKNLNIIHADATENKAAGFCANGMGAGWLLINVPGSVSCHICVTTVYVQFPVDYHLLTLMLQNRQESLWGKKVLSSKFRVLSLGC